MMKHAIAASALLLLAACGGGDEAGNNSSDSGQTVEQTPANLQDDPNNQAVPLSPPTPMATPSASPVAALPADFQGRWGLVDDDCIPGHGEHRGLMIVAADGLGFGSSRGQIEGARQVRPGAIEIDLLFTGGAGDQWNRRETLTLLDDGKTLVREEQKPASSNRYTRCPAGKEGPVSPTGA